MATKLESKNANDSSAEEHNSLTTLNNRASLTQGIDVPSPVDDDDTILVPGTVESAKLEQGLLLSEDWEVYTESVIGSQFHVTTTADSSLMSYLYDFFNTTVYDHPGNLTGNIAEVLTNQIRSNNPGDNVNATVLNGRAWTDKTYIRARCQWLILPSSETILTRVLLVVSICITKGQGLWKSSTAALLLHKLGGWTEEELSLTWEQTSEQLDAKTERMVATLKRDEDGAHGFYKAP
ncbi:uncharacterized protein F4817DRAFT_314148 [Daldinia loculata]|uniref:uncharacterized protein n=1 Tax=Daldinia loculata TaxID=103429 RepID=UPI0020C28A9F|nr:uncharacterized protein F4817DRAFT_314148 [Daldinia loculata]KAI1649208.1 hypothetical protein F4817DRAFT_314148 [Daldinia loculata]